LYEIEELKKAAEISSNDETKICAGMYRSLL